MPKKTSKSITVVSTKREKTPDILDYIDENKEKVREVAGEEPPGVLEKGAGDALNKPLVKPADSAITGSQSNVSTSTTDSYIGKSKKTTKKSSLKLKVKVKTEKQTKLEVTTESPNNQELETGTSSRDVEPSTSEANKETSKRKSFLNLGRKSTSKTPKAEVKSDEPEVKAAKSKKTVRSKLLTDFFPVRRSDRRSKADLEKMEAERLEQKILSGCENGLQVVDAASKGRGVISTKPFKRGEFVVEYAGNLITLSEAQAKEDHYSMNPDIGCYMYYFKFNNKNYCVDATAETGKLGRLLNHSKSGNCKTKVVGIGDRPYLILIAARDIEKNEELLYDYGDRSREAIQAHPWLAQ